MTSSTSSHFFGASNYYTCLTLSANEYALNLSTQSGVKELPADAQAALLERVERRIDRTGGTVTVHHLALVTVAKRAS